MKQISTALKAARAKKGWTQFQLDEKAGMALGTTAQYEIGRTPGIQALKQMAKALGVSPLALMGE